MTALVPQQNSQLAKRTTPVLSPGLKSLLELEPSNERAVELIVQVPALKAEARELLPALKEQALAPAGEVGVTRVVGKRFAIYPQREMSVEESAAWWADYFDVLADVPEDALEAGMQLWIRNPQNEFLPKPAQLRQLAMQAENRAARAYERARKAAEYEPPKVYDKRDLPAFELPSVQRSPEDIARVKKWAAEYLANVDAKAPEKREPIANHGPTDERGLTPQMREIMARRAEQ